MHEQAVLVGLGRMENLDLRVLHADREPLSGGTIAQGEYLRVQVVLLQLPAFPQVPRTYSVVEPSCPELRAFRGDVDAGGAVRVALELSNQNLVVQIPHGDVTVAAATEADFRVRRDGQRVACRRRGGQFRFDPRRRAGQVPDDQLPRLASDYQGSAVW